MPVKKIFADEKGMVYLNCPFCGDVSVGRADSFANIPQPVQLTCICGNKYEIQIEFRKSFRKRIMLEGFYSRISPPGSFEKMAVTDISMGGCRFLPSNRHLLKNGDQIKVVFNLDNTNRTRISKEAIICNITEQSAGCKFAVTGNGYDPDIGFYLRSA
jgi:hypothetical protein